MDEKQQQRTNHNIAHRQPLTASALITTSISCATAALITYPAENYRTRWEKNTLRLWDPDMASLQEKYEISDSTRAKQISSQLRFRILSPVVRLTFNELAGSLMKSTLTQEQQEIKRAEWKHDIWAGTIAGICQSTVLTPLEAWRANQIMFREKEAQREWRYWLSSQVLTGWTGDPEERRRRAFRAVGVTAAREIVFNTTFFPLFHTIQRNLLQMQALQTQSRDDSSKSLPYSATVMASGVFAGMACSLAVTPMDIFRSYMMHSRETWSIWSGTKLHAAPIPVLCRGLVLQAFCFGPAFGVVASIYELT